jgi:hypothetical protein
MVDTCVAADKLLLDNCAVFVWALCKKLPHSVFLQLHHPICGSDAMHLRWLDACKGVPGSFRLQLALMMLFRAQGVGRQNKPRHNAHINIADAPALNT